MRHFIRFYEFLLQVSCFEDVDLHKKYNFMTYLLSYINIKHPGGGFKYMEASTRTPYGKIRVRWEADGDVIRAIEVSVPVGTQALVHCPDGEVRTLGSGNYGFGVELE